MIKIGIVWYFDKPELWVSITTRVYEFYFNWQQGTVDTILCNRVCDINDWKYS